MKKPAQQQNSVLRPQSRGPIFKKLDDGQKRTLAESKWIVVIGVTVVAFIVSGGYKFLNAAEMHSHFSLMTNNMQQTNVWVRFFLTFGIAGALGAAILTTAGIDYLTHSKGNRR